MAIFQNKARVEEMNLSVEAAQDPIKEAVVEANEEIKQKAICNAPSLEALKEIKRRNGKQVKRLNLTYSVRTGVDAVTDDPEFYKEIQKHLAGGDVTGSAFCDLIYLADAFVEFESENERHALKNAVQSGETTLQKVAVKMRQELRNIGLDIKQNVIVGYLNGPSA